MRLSKTERLCNRRELLTAFAAITVANRSWLSPIVAASQDAWRTSPVLRWAPPAQQTPITIDVPETYFSTPAIPPDQDAIIRLPKRPRRPGADLRIVGGRHVRLIGGQTMGRLQWADGTGSIFVEGLAIDLTATPNRDAIVVAGARDASPDVYLQSVLVTGVQGTFAGTHADVFQPYGAIGHLRVHCFTADTNYQGFFIRPEHPIKSATFSHVNMKFNALGAPESNTFLFWSRNLRESPARGDAHYPVEYGPQVYAEANAKMPGRAAAFPPPGFRLPGRDEREFDGIAAADGSVTWPLSSGIVGQVLLGSPPSGDFVRLADVGVNYRSPGYSE
jgi:hypothetical protein